MVGADGTIIGRKNQSGDVGKFVKNEHGDVTDVISENGNSTYQYEPWGTITAETGTFDNPIRYSGEYYDDESGLIYLRNRYYDPSLRRFISVDPAKDGLNWYAYCGNNPVNYWDPWGEDAIVITNSEAAVKQGHTSAIYQDVNGDWFYTYWGNKAAAVIRISHVYMGTLDDFNNGLNKFLADNGFEDITSNYNSSTYIVGDFTASLDAAYAYVRGAHSNSFHKDSKTHELDDGSVVFQGQNSNYNLLWNNCLERTYASLSKGTLANGMNAGTYMKDLGFKGGIIPNKAISKFGEVFMNSSFTYGGAYSALLNYATLYVQGSLWAQKWGKANYANSVIGW